VGRISRSPDRTCQRAEASYGIVRATWGTGMCALFGLGGKAIYPLLNQLRERLGVPNFRKKEVLGIGTTENYGQYQTGPTATHPRVCQPGGR
jgi:hypothetical protein